MHLFNDKQGYGAATKLLHWSVAVLLAVQFVLAAIMLSLVPGQSFAGLSGDTYYNWHKSLGLVTLGLVALRLLARRAGRLPDWAPTLSAAEQAFIHRAERVLYAGMIALPVSGFVYVMAGGYGVLLFGRWQLPNPIGRLEPLAIAAQWLHVVSAYILLATATAHVALVLRHQLVLRDRLLVRMLPGRGATGEP